MGHNIKNNIFFSSILTTANYIFPLIVFPYVSRVLGVDNIGLVSFIDSIINYFILFSSLGLSVVGIREIASCNNDRQRMGVVFSSLVLISMITTLIGLIGLTIATIYIEQLWAHRSLLMVGGIKLLFNIFLIEWFYKGIENFKYITIRTIIVRCIYVVLVFLFVRSKNDSIIYYSLTTLTIVINATINILNSRSLVKFSFKNTSIRDYIGSVVNIGVYTILTSMYTSFNVLYLGFSSNDTQVGYYTTATKLFSIILSLYTAFTGVMMPRMSKILSEGKKEEFKRKTKQSISILVLIAVPALILSELFAPEIVLLLSGKGYEGAILPMRIVMPLILIIGFEQILVIQMMMPLKKDKEILRNSICGAILGVILNIILVPYLMAVGSAIIWLCCEVLILLLSLKCMRTYININDFIKLLFRQIVRYIPLILVLLLVNFSQINYISKLIIAISVTIISFIGISYSQNKILFNGIIMKLKMNIKNGR